MGKLVLVSKHKTIAYKSVILLSALFFSHSSSTLSTKLINSCSPPATQAKKSPEKRITSGFPSESSYKKVQAANQALADGNPELAKSLLNQVKNSSAWSNPYVESVVSQYLSRMELDAGNHQKAIALAEKVVKLDALPVTAILGMKKQIAYSYYGSKDFAKAINWMNQYFQQVASPSSSDYKLLANLYYNNKQYKQAVCPLSFALKQSKPKDRQPIYRMLYSSHQAANEITGATKILSHMINLYPETKEYWEKLYSTYYRINDLPSALAVHELGYKKGIWSKESEFITLASLHAKNQSPYTAALRLEEAIHAGIVKSNLDNWELVANYYDTAKATDKAIAAFNKCSSYSNSGKYHYRVGNIYSLNEQHQSAIDEFKKAINKGNMKKSDLAYSHLQLGIALYYTGAKNIALKSLQQATQYPKTRNNAEQWAKFIREQQMQAKKITTLNEADNK